MSRVDRYWRRELICVGEAIRSNKEETMRDENEVDMLISSRVTKLEVYDTVVEALDGSY